MPDFLEKEGPSAEEAVFAAVTALGISEAEAQVQILYQAPSGRAKVRVARKGVELPPVDPSLQAPVEPVQHWEKPAPRPERTGTPLKPAGPEEAEALRERLEHLLKAMSMDSTVSVKQHLGMPTLDIRGGQEGLLIGKKGATLQALQTLANAWLNASERHDTKRIQVDVSDYRARHESELAEKAKLFAEQALQDGGQVATGSLSAPDRRVVHLVLKEYPELESFSVGEGELKRVVIQKRE
jgi:spoIIIJ-associated protein